MRHLIKRILREETQKDLSPLIKKLLDDSVLPNHKLICRIDVVAPWKLIGHNSTSDYQVMVSVIGGAGSKNWPMTQFVHGSRDKVVNDVWQTVYDYMGIPTDVFLRTVKTCDEVMSEGLHDTSWENEEGDKITLVDLLDATEDIPVKNVLVNKLKSKLLTWDGDENEIAKIEKADLEYPILISVDDDGKFISIIDGHHRVQKALKHKLKTIKAKLIPINSLPKNIKKVFGHLGKQEQNEGELTERCWKGYTQKGMKTMFGKRYPNCVKKK